MPNNVTDSARDEEKWEKAEGIAKKQLGHAPKSDNDWAYVMGIYKKMKPDHQFKSEKSASKKFKTASSGRVLNQWMARRVVARKEAGVGPLLHKWEQENPRAKTKAESKDTKRIDDMVSRAGSESMAMKKARQMARSVKDVAKALRRADAASNLGYVLIEDVFRRRAAEIIAYGRKASEKEARVQTMRLDKGLQRKVNADMRKAGLDGNGRFRKAEDGYSMAVNIMRRWNLEIDGTAHSHLFNTDSGKVTVDIAMTNNADKFSPFPVVNSMLVIQFHKLENNRFEVLGYLS